MAAVGSNDNLYYEGSSNCQQKDEDDSGWIESPMFGKQISPFYFRLEMSLIELIDLLPVYLIIILTYSVFKKLTSEQPENVNIAIASGFFSITSKM